MKQIRFVILVVVLLNVVVLGWLLLSRSQSGTGERLDQVVTPLLSDATMESARYDLSDKADKLNVIVISLDALRFDRTGISGNKSGLTPNIDQFADEAVVFHNAQTVASWTLPSHMSIWTARWPSVHGVTNKLRPLSGDQLVETSLSPGIETWPDLLIRSGRIAAGFTGGAGVQGRYGFSRGFDEYLDDRYFGGLDYSIPPALTWLDTHKSQPFFLFLHGYDTHGQYELPESERKSITGYGGHLDGSKEEQARLREEGLTNIKNPGDAPDLTGKLDAADAKFLMDVYDLKVRDADQRLGTFLSRLKAMGLYDNSIIAVISDHGDEFMEHGSIDHGTTLYQEQLHVVMMVRFPGYGRRQDIQETVRTIDLFPTIFDVMGMAGVPGADGESLLALLQGKPEQPPLFAETDYRLFVHHRAIRQGNYKLILDLLDGKRELYDLGSDPGELRNISSQEPRRTYEMEQVLRGWMDTSQTNPQDYLGLAEKHIIIF